MLLYQFNLKYIFSDLIENFVPESTEINEVMKLSYNQ